jgi:hypothetical protein
MQLKPGQLCTINRHVYRAQKREFGCFGCYFDDCFFTCPGVKDAKTKEKRVDCILNNIILKRVIVRGRSL